MRPAPGSEVIADGFLAVGDHEDDVGDTGGDDFLNGVLDEGLVDDREHFFRDGLGRGEHAGAESGCEDDGFGDGCHGCIVRGEGVNGYTGMYGAAMMMIRLNSPGEQFEETTKSTTEASTAGTTHQ